MTGAKFARESMALAKAHGLSIEQTAYLALQRLYRCGDAEIDYILASAKPNADSRQRAARAILADLVLECEALEAGEDSGAPYDALGATLGRARLALIKDRGDFILLLRDLVTEAENVAEYADVMPPMACDTATAYLGSLPAARA